MAESKTYKEQAFDHLHGLVKARLAGVAEPGRYTRSMRLLLAGLAALLALAAAARADSLDAAPSDPAGRVAHHVRLANEIATHFDDVLRQDCPRFGTAAEWDTYLDGEIDRLVLLMAHLEQAWVEAKTTPDDEVRRTAKAPRRRLHEARPLLDKLQACARDHGSDLEPLPVWWRIQREVPRRQAEIALPR